MSIRTGIQYPEPIRPVPAPPGQLEAVALGAIPLRATVAVAGTTTVSYSQPCRITMVTLEAGAAIATLRIFDGVSTADNTPDKRIAGVKAPINDYRGWSNSRGIRVTRGVVFTLDQTDAEGWIYIIPGI